MDEAFRPFAELVRGLVPALGELVDEAAGVRSAVTAVRVDCPIELDVVRGQGDALTLGSTPPLYYVDTTFRPSFHRLRLTAELDGGPGLHGDPPAGDAAGVPDAAGW